MNLNEFQPKEIVYMHCLLGTIVDTYTDVLQKGGVTYEHQTPFGVIKHFEKLDQPDLDKIATHDRFVTAKGIQNKLADIVHVIKTSTPEIYQEGVDAYSLQTGELPDILNEEDAD